MAKHKKKLSPLPDFTRQTDLISQLDAISAELQENVLVNLYIYLVCIFLPIFLSLFLEISSVLTLSSLDHTLHLKSTAM